MLTMIGIPIFLLNRDRRGQYLIIYPFVVVASSLVGVSMSYMQKSICTRTRQIWMQKRKRMLSEILD